MTWAEVAQVPLCLLTPDMQNRRIIDDLLRAAGGDPQPTLESNSVMVLFAHVRTGRWATVMPSKLAETLGLTDTIRAIPIVEPEAVHTIGLVVPAREPMTPLTAALVAEAQAGGETLKMDERRALNCPAEGRRRRNDGNVARSSRVRASSPTLSREGGRGKASLRHLLVRWRNMTLRASSSISVLNVCWSFSAIARLRRRTRADLVDQALEVRELGPAVLAEHDRNQPRPAPHVHVDDRVGVADHVFLLGETRVEDAVMTLRLVGVAVDRVVEFFSGA